MGGGSGERRDESVSFSLRQLRELEDERVEQERKEREASELAAARAQAEASSRAREAEQGARERARRLSLDDLARREAMHRAIVEQTRIEVEARGRAEGAERERRRELELARIRAARPKTRPAALVASALAGMALSLAGAAAAYAGIAKPGAERRVAAIEDAAREAGRAAERDLEALARDGDEKRRRLERALAAAEQRLAEVEGERRGASPPAPRPRVPRSRSAPSTPLAPGTPCHPRDPMCFSLETPRR
jgi:colicin import membrane protein